MCARTSIGRCTRLREGELLRGVASCCMDTSDGFVATIDQLARINEVGFRITAPAADCCIRWRLG